MRLARVSTGRSRDPRRRRGCPGRHYLRGPGLGAQEGVVGVPGRHYLRGPRDSERCDSPSARVWWGGSRVRHGRGPGRSGGRGGGSGRRTSGRGVLRGTGGVLELGPGATRETWVGIRGGSGRGRRSVYWAELFAGVRAPGQSYRCLREGDGLDSGSLGGSGPTGTGDGDDGYTHSERVLSLTLATT